MDQKLFEFIWDQSKKSQDKNLIEFIVGLNSGIKDFQANLCGDIDRVYQEINVNKGELMHEISGCHDDLQLQINEIRRRLDDGLYRLEMSLREEFGKTEVPANTEK